MAERIIIVRDRQQLLDAVREARAGQARWWVFGGLSNVLFPDEPLHGTVIINRTRGLTFDDATLQARVQSGTPMVMLIKAAVQRGWEGLTWATGLPGSVGGAVINNAGSFGGQISDVLTSAEIWDTETNQIQAVPASWFEFAYRHSHLKGRPSRYVVLTLTFQFKPDTPETLKQHQATYQQQRMLTQPSGRSLGSVFVNPPGDYAGRLIEAAGLKGTRQGGVVISERHANFFINKQRGTAADYLALIQLARKTVAEKFGVLLTPEIEIIKREGQ